MYMTAKKLGLHRPRITNSLPPRTNQQPRNSWERKRKKKSYIDSIVPLHSPNCIDTQQTEHAGRNPRHFSTSSTPSKDLTSFHPEPPWNLLYPRVYLSSTHSSSSSSMNSKYKLSKLNISTPSIFFPRAKEHPCAIVRFAQIRNLAASHVFCSHSCRDSNLPEMALGRIVCMPISNYRGTD
ncbi:unnamed protein product [Periconia digitata]|uniref:Uncharacterized protein n=1 Tax=Periconia digitata TaxID=1303443 RepID=A0A9W4XRP8_9PLEO|nr:unnamed protein product [Periconia digitata]